MKNEVKRKLIESLHILEKTDPYRQQHLLEAIRIKDLDKISEKERADIFFELKEDGEIEGFSFRENGEVSVMLKELKYILLDNSDSGKNIKEVVVITTKLPLKEYEIKNEVKRKYNCSSMEVIDLPVEGEFISSFAAQNYPYKIRV